MYDNRQVSRHTESHLRDGPRSANAFANSGQSGMNQQENQRVYRYAQGAASYSDSNEDRHMADVNSTNRAAPAQINRK